MTLRKTFNSQKKGFPLSWQENERLNLELFSKQPPVSLQEAKEQVNKVSDHSFSTVKKGSNTIEEE
ncbi:MAG TPA: hypothetical protein VM871_11490 [Flavisolibacter sp.]|nr:hypothetical protein [Flavisolibacter sp.]